LTDPFEIAPEWQDWPASGEVMPPWRFLADVGERLGSRGLRRRLRAGTETPDPLVLNQTALELRKRSQLEEAERLLRQAIEIEDRQVAPDSPKRPHRRNNLAIVLMRAGRLDESRQLNAEAWRLKARQHDLTSGRILFVRIALGYLADRCDVSLYVGQLKVLLNVEPLECFGDVASTWDIPDVLGMLREGLPRAKAEFLVQVAETLNDRSSLPSLEAFAAWRAAAGMPLEARWPDD
jgi:hypothetical protein